MLRNKASDQGLHCLPLIQQFYTHQQAVKWTCSNFRTSILRSEVRILRVNRVWILVSQKRPPFWSLRFAILHTLTSSCWFSLDHSHIHLLFPIAYLNQFQEYSENTTARKQTKTELTINNTTFHAFVYFRQNLWSHNSHKTKWNVANLASIYRA